MTDFKNLLQKFIDIGQVHDLIQVLEELLQIADGQRILEMLDIIIGKHLVTKKISTYGAIAEIENFLTEVLKDTKKIPSVGIPFSMLGSVLARFNQMSENKSDCLELLRRMFNLGRRILQLNEEISYQMRKLSEGVQCIFVGTTICISQLATANIFRFLITTVNADSLEDFKAKMDGLYSDIQLLTLIDKGKRVPKIASQSKKIYGFESAREDVIQLLDLNARDSMPIVVVVYGYGGFGKTTLADAVYAHINLQSYKHCKIHLDQDCTYNDLKLLQEQIVYGLFRQNKRVKNCDQGQAILYSLFKENPNQPLFLYIDNALKSRDLEKLLPQGLGGCLPANSRMLVTTRKLYETDIFVGRNIERRQYDVNPLPVNEARKLLLEKVSDYNDEHNIYNLVQLCGGVPLLLELAGSQLAINRGNTKNIVLEMLNEGEKVKEKDISDRMVGFVFDRLLEPVQEAFLDIASYFYNNWESRQVASIVGEEEFRALEAASFVKISEAGNVIVHDIIRARGKNISEKTRITNPETLLECLKDEETLKNLKGIYFSKEYELPPIEINCDHLNRMSNSLRVLAYQGSQIAFREKCNMPFQQLRYLQISSNIPDLPVKFEKLEHLIFYDGPFPRDMSLYEFPPSLRIMYIEDSSNNRAAYSKIPPRVAPHSSLVQLVLDGFKNMLWLPDGLEMLRKLEDLSLLYCHQLRELPARISVLSNLKVLTLVECNKLEALSSDFGQLSNLEVLTLHKCNELKALPSNFAELGNLKVLTLYKCTQLEELPSDFGRLSNLRWLQLEGCYGLNALPTNFGDLLSLEYLNLRNCSSLKELPSNFGQLKNLEELDLNYCSGLEEWPASFEDLAEVKGVILIGCSLKLKESLPHNIKGIDCIIYE
ncbi:disease resistance protein TAO1 isoform X2 [Cryptomeria japonica]|uniref:disease resistance protein TAO1 isoform X2 n=1 Tax=Cryptomeria japonica TaxID=3369 RepID=UPI0027DA0628|nr:disease resistance protein TAO1 isoform X2 [Cryptomeria japonica]